MRALGGSSLAVASEVCTPASRVVVDEYVTDGAGSYKLRSVATDLLRYLRAQVGREPETCLCGCFHSPSMLPASQLSHSRMGVMVCGHPRS